MGRMSNSEAMVGVRIGGVVVIGREYNARRREWEFRCRCDCGVEFVSRRDGLKAGRVGCRRCANRANWAKKVEATRRGRKF